MRITNAVGALQAVLSAFTASSNVTYNVISLVPNNQTLGVIVDNQLYPLSMARETSIIFYTGQAPRADKQYKYAHISKDGYDIINQEKFSRDPTKGSSSTLNEYYGRSWNSKKLDQIPTIREQLPFINRISSDLHIDGEIPTIHFFGNQSAIDRIHVNQRESINIDLNMTYISPHKIKIYPKVTFAISGHSTRFNDKVSYKFRVPKEDTLFGYHHLKLRSISTDKTYMRDNLAYDITESIGLPSSKHSYVRVYINDQAVGLFGLAEIFKKQWVRNEMSFGKKNKHLNALYVADISGGRGMDGGPPRDSSPRDSPPRDSPPRDSSPRDSSPRDSPPRDSSPRDSPPRDGPPGNGHHLPGGGGFPETGRGKNSDLTYLGNNIDLYSAGYYGVKASSARGTANFSRIMDLTRFISEQLNATNIDDSVVPLWKEKIDVDSLLRMIALEIVISNSDAYLTMANNYILYDDYESDRVAFSAQDFDLTMGSAINNAGFSTRPLTSSLIRVPKFKQDLERLIYRMTKDLVNTKLLAPRIESLRDFLLEDVVWDQNLPRLGKGLRRPGHNNDNDSKMEPETAFLAAIHGPTNSTRSMALLDWIEFRSNNILDFFERLK